MRRSRVRIPLAPPKINIGAFRNPSGEAKLARFNSWGSTSIRIECLENARRSGTDWIESAQRNELEVPQMFFENWIAKQGISTVKLNRTSSSVFLSPLRISMKVLNKDKATKCIWWMPWHKKSMKDVTGCDKLRGAANKRYYPEMSEWGNPLVRSTRISKREQPKHETFSNLEIQKITMNDFCFWDSLMTWKCGMFWILNFDFLLLRIRTQ